MKEITITMESSEILSRILPDIDKPEWPSSQSREMKFELGLFPPLWNFTCFSHWEGPLTISFLIITDQCYMGDIYIWWSFMFAFQRIHIVLTILLMRSPLEWIFYCSDHHRPMLHCWYSYLNKLHILLAIFSFILSYKLNYDYTFIIS